MATLEQIAEGIRRAHAAGDAENVQKLGAAYRAMQGQAAPDDPDDGWSPPGMIVPVQFKKGTGEPRWAVPQAVTDLGSALSSVTKAATGQYGIEVDPETGRPTTVTNEMIGDAMGAASLGLTTLSPAAAAGAKFGQQAIGAPARRMLQRELKNAGIPLDQIGPRLATIGPDAMVADLSPGLQARAAAIATMPGSGQKSIVDALAARRAGSNARIIADVDATLGSAPVPSRLQGEIKANQQALSPTYADALQNAAQVNTADLADNLDVMAGMLRGDAQKAVQRVRSMLNSTDDPNLLDPNPSTLLQTRMAIDGLMDGLTDGNTIRALTAARKQVDDLLASAVPGIKEIDAQFEQLADQAKALKTGSTVLSSGKEAPVPEEVADMMKANPSSALFVGPSAAPLRLSQGARAEIERIIGTNVRDITAMKRIVAGEGNWNRDRMATVFGSEKADALLDILEREALFDITEQLGLAGSRTQVLKAAQEDIVGKGPRPNPARSVANFRFGDAIADTLDQSLGWVSSGKRSSTNQQIADALIAQSRNGPMIEAISRKPAGMSERAWLDLLRAYAQQPDYVGSLGGQIGRGVTKPVEMIAQALLGPRR